ncbi:hypothetical protein LEMLEM_LOCUS1732 [Lemmus lemmus]
MVWRFSKNGRSYSTPELLPKLCQALCGYNCPTLGAILKHEDLFVGVSVLPGSCIWMKIKPDGFQSD